MTNASEKRREKHLWVAFDITPAEWDRVSDYQGGVCFCCGRKSIGKRLATEHDHASGLFRGLLCASCNSLLGKVENAFTRYGLRKVEGLSIIRVLTQLALYLDKPPAVKALGREAFGYPGRIGTIEYRKWAKKKKKCRGDTKD